MNQIKFRLIQLHNLKSLFFSLLFFAHVCNGQKHDYNWVIGGRSDSTSTNCIIRFSDTQPTTAIATTGYVQFDRSNASISDSSGNLLFFTNGINVYNRDFQPIPGALLQNSFTLPWENIGFNRPHDFIFLPWPGDTNLFVLFYCIPDTSFSSGCTGWGWAGLANHLYYTILDKTLNGGLGGIASANNIAYTGLLPRLTGLAAVKHANGRDWWVIVKNACNDAFQTFLFTPFGITHNGQQFCGTPLTSPQIALSSFTPDGTIYMMIRDDHDVNLFHFDRCTGTLSNSLIVHSNFGVSAFYSEFSSDSRYLYRIVDSQHIIQYDLANYLVPGAVENSGQIVGSTDTFSCVVFPVTTHTYLMTPKLGPDEKIYIAHQVWCDVLSIINYPDSAGASCAPAFHNFILPNGAGASLSNNPNYRLAALSGSICDSLSTGIEENTSSLISLFPNPASDSFVITLNQHQSATIELYSIEGKKVGEKHYPIPANSFQYDFEAGINSGLYIVRILLRNQVISRKVVIN